MPGPGNPNIAEYGKATRVKKGQRLPGCGRKPSRLKQLQKQYQYSAEDLQNAIAATEAYTLDKLKKLSKDEKADVCMRTIAIARVKAMAKGDLTALNILWDRAYGKAAQTIDQTNRNIDFKDMNQEERDSVFSDLMDKYNKVESGE